MPPQENQNPDQFSQIVDSLRQANNVLVTVKSNPSVDQLAACIALTVALNKQNKHATAVFSGAVPSTIGFLEPEKTLEQNTDSLRDFIISLDKSKADKLRYKVEDEVVKIFITPYKTSISDKDLEFSQGDFNVDTVIALGVHDRNEFDQAILAHGRILHDATVASINIEAGGELGAINWLDTASSSLCEMVSDLIGALGKELLDSQISTALLTGIVAETDRFRNEKSSPHTMSVSGTLMAAGASTQLVSSKLEEPEVPSDEIPEVSDNGDAEAVDPGMIQIDHGPDDDILIDDHSGELRKVAEIIEEQEQAQVEPPQEPALPPQPDAPQIVLESREQADREPEAADQPASNMILQPPSMGGQLTANSEPEQYSPSTDPLSNAENDGPLLSHDAPQTEAAQTLSEIEKSLNSPHVADQPTEQPVAMPPAPAEEFMPPASVSEEVPPPPAPDDARDAVQKAVEALQDYRPEPTEAVGSTPVDLDLGHDEEPPQPPPASNDNPPPPVPPPLPPQ